MIVLHASIAIVVIVALIIWAKVNPVIALVIGSLYLGIAAGLGMVDTVTTIADGFGDIMVDVGLLIGFGVLIGALLNAMGALQRTVQLLFRIFGPRKLPYAMAVALNLFFPSIYPDVQLVLASPLARSSAERLGKNGLGLMAGALVVGIPVGVVLMVPGLGAVSIAGLLDIPLSVMLLCGAIAAPLISITTLAIYQVMLKFGWWSPQRDEHPSDALLAEEQLARDAVEKSSDVLPPLRLSILPVLIPVVLVGGGAIARTTGIENSLVDFLSEPLLAMFLGLVAAYVLAVSTVGRKTAESAIERGLDTTGNILLITGLGGSLAAVIRATDLSDVLESLFVAEVGMGVIATVFLAWLIAAVLHVAIGSINVAAIAAAGIIGPVVASAGVAPIIVALSIAAGALFAVHFNSNFFWMFQSLTGVNTSGALRSMTFLTSLASVIGLVLISIIALIFG
ncbi:GntP family permease [Corynebacterium sp.]|uniref:GntP family permease n=1 Tax=Corynebacterium sp. TaxID=1720 RepID=UPI003B3BA6C3